MTEQEATLQIRSSALTTLALTRHPQLQVRRSALADTTHKEVFFKGDEEDRSPRLLVFFHGEWKIASQKQAERVAKKLVNTLVEEDPPLPLLLAVFSHADDRGWITWVVKPEDGELMVQSAPACRPFDRVALDDIVSVVKDWQPAVSVGKRA